MEKIRVYDIEFRQGLCLPDIKQSFVLFNPLNENQLIEWKLDFIVLWGNIRLKKINDRTYRPVYDSRFKRHLTTSGRHVSKVLTGPDVFGRSYPK